eukprot:10925301-Lingulodinium_polyedra.AAC.1
MARQGALSRECRHRARWQDADGGELESLPFPFPDVALAPLAGRLVAFSALGTMHRVRPFRGPARAAAAA